MCLSINNLGKSLKSKEKSEDGLIEIALRKSKLRECLKEQPANVALVRRNNECLITLKSLMLALGD